MMGMRPWLRPLILLPLLLALALAPCALGGDSPPEVEVSAGKLRGKWTATQSGRPIAAFEGIPYAQPPVGQLRFQPPVPSAPWSGVLVADQPGHMCLQRNILFGAKHFEGSEDCLTLNVYAPQTVYRSEPLPVMVYIHGGGFFSGSGVLYGPEMILDQDVLLVNFNYRLGPLGFLSTGDEVIPGNFGMKDQVLVLRWVQQNIRAFGGDPEKVTIFGESAGGASVHHQVLSPLSKGLFHRAIALSGTALAHWAFHDAPIVKRAATKIAAAVGCPATPSEKLKQCLMAKPAEDIAGVDAAFVEWQMHPLVPFSVVAEPSGPGAFQDRHPNAVLADAVPNDVPFMTGFVSEEGCIASAFIVDHPELLKEVDTRFADIMRIVMFTVDLPEDLNRKMYGRLREFYFGDKRVENGTRQAFSDMLTDAFIAHATLESVKYQSQVVKSPVYLYELSHLSERTFAYAFGAKASTHGMCHADDLLYLFPLKMLSPLEPSDSDKAFSRKLIDLFTTFAASGRPTKDDSWKPVQHPDHAEYAFLGQDAKLVMRQDFEPERMKVWTKLPVNMALAFQRSTGREEL